MSIKKLSTPLDLGKELQVVNTSVGGAFTETYEFSIDAESVLISLFVSSTAGDVDVNVTTEGSDGSAVNVISFPTISAATPGILLRKSASVLRKIRVNIVTTDSATFEIRARGVSSAASSVLIEGSSTFSVSQTDVSTTAGVLVSASLQDRRGILIRNNSAGAQILYIADTLAKATTAEGYPIPNGGNITIDLQAGAEIYSVADSGLIDVRIVQVGGT